MAEPGAIGHSPTGGTSGLLIRRLVSDRTQAGVFVVFAALLIIAAGMMMFSTFMLYDDEGYVLLSLRNFAARGHLYGEVYTQYGPFPYVFYATLHALGIPLTHNVGRLITIAAWSGAALASAGMVWRATGSLAARMAVLAGVFVYLWIMVSEPTHPGGLIAGSTALLAWLGHRWISADRPRAWAILAGAGVAALLLTKINIGVFAGFAAVAWLLLHHKNAAIRRWAPGVLIAAVALLPFLLMRSLLGTPWVQTYAMMFACSAGGAVGAAALGATQRAGWREVGAGALAALGVAVVVLGVIFARGTSPAELLEGVLLGPLRHPGSFSLKFPWPAATTIVAIASPVLFSAAWLLRRRGVEGVDSAVAMARLVATLALVATVARFPGISPDNLVLAFAAPCLWLFLWPVAGENPSLVAARSWVGLLFLGQSLHAFPVPGSQIAWGTFLALPLAALGAWPAAVYLAGRAPVPPGRYRAGGLAIRTLVAGFAMLTAVRLVQVGNRYLEGRTLELSGSGPLRLPDSATALYRLLAMNAAAHADVLFSLPGMFSLNLWSQVPTPTLTNVTHWFSLLDEKRQRAIVDSLSAHPRACVIVQRDHVDFLIKRNLGPAGTLHDFIKLNYEPAFEVAGFEFWVKKGRRIAPLLTAEVFRLQAPAGGAQQGRGDTLLKLQLLLPPGRTVDSVEITPMNGADFPPLLLTNANARVEITPMDLGGTATRPLEFRRFPFALSSPSVVALYFDRAGQRFEVASTLIVVRDAAGEELALVRMLP